MNLFKKFYHFFKRTGTEYLYSSVKKIELFVCVSMMITISVCLLLNIIPGYFKGISSQFQSFAAVYLAFRLSYYGMTVALTFNTFELLSLSFRYGHSHNSDFLIAISVKIFTMLTCVIVGMLSGLQEKHKKKLERMAVTDELTDVFNQRYYHSILENEIAKAQKNRSSVGLILIDIDNFKVYNDTYGHDCGDIILKETASLIKEIIKDEGVICRIGGDEFGVILENKDSQALQNTAQRIKHEYEKIKRNFYKNNFSYKVTLSMGMSEYPDISKSKDELISQADMALYHAKNLGKNKINFYQDVILQIRKNITTDHQQLIGIFKGLLSTISTKDKYTLGHCERVSAYTTMIGEALNLEVKDISILQCAGLLHDIGKIELPKSVLNKIGPLTEEEFYLIRNHPVYSANILEPLEGMDQLIDYVRHHHERFDGKGYPDRLSGKNISFGARILCVADSFDAMISERPYSKSLTQEEALHELEQCAGYQFDAEIVKVFIGIIRSKEASSSLHTEETDMEPLDIFATSTL